MTKQHLIHEQVHQKKTILYYLCVILALVFLSGSADALDPNTNVSQYVHMSWKIQDGFFKGSPRCIAQTTDGYIWIGTESGLFRFDGSQFRPWPAAPGTHLPSNLIRSLLAARDGSLWIGTDAGLVHVVNGISFQIPNVSDSIEGLLEDPSGAIWFVRISNDLKSPLCEVSGGGIQCPGESEGVRSIPCCADSIARDVYGDLWIGTTQYLLRWKPGASREYRPKEFGEAAGIEGANALAPAPDGSIWVGWARQGPGLGLEKLKNNISTPVILPGFDSSTLFVLSLFLDRDGGLWIGTDRGIFHLHDRHLDRFDTSDGLSSNAVFRFLEDREGGIWAVTAKGIDSFHQSAVTTFTSREGLKADNVVSVVTSRDNTVWLANWRSLTSIKDGRISAIESGKGLPGYEVTSLFVDHSDQLWLGVDSDLYLYRNGQFRRVRGIENGVQRTDRGSKNYIVGITEDTYHDIWAEVSGSDRKLIRIHDLKTVDEFPPAIVPSARPLSADAQGGVWLGLRDGNLARFQNGRVEVFGFPHEVNSPVRQVLVNPDDSVFGTTAFGLIGWRNGKTQALRTGNGLPCDGIIGMAWDDLGALWLYTECGLVRIEKADIDRWWADPNIVVTPRIFDVFDGVQPGIPDFNPAAKSTDGKLWFANQSALQMIDPSHLTRNEIPPPVHLQAVIADRKSYSATDGLRLPPLMRDLEIDYTALSFVNPRQVRFRYRLSGHDAAWQEAGVRRQAFYNDLHPGKYRFQVIACNNDGVWNEEGVSLNFAVLPAWYQTNIFRMLAFAMALLVTWTIYRLRARQIAESMSIRFDERLAERTRLATDLHDTLLQTLQGSKLVADLALERPSDADYMHRSLKKLTGWLDRAMHEGRSALNALRTTASEGNDLAKSFRHALDDCQLQGLEEGILNVNGIAIELHPIVHHEIYRIGYEAIHNACQHAKATRVEVELIYRPDFKLVIRDNGEGIDPSILAHGKDGHFGLQSMRERSVRIGGHFQLLTSENDGTTIILTVPKKSAFRHKTKLGRTFSGDRGK